MDVGKLLIQVNAEKQQAAADDLEKIANKQKENIGKLKELRYVQDKIAEVTADGVIEEDEHYVIQDLLEMNGLDRDGFWLVNGATDGQIQGNHNWDADERMYLEADEEHGVTEEGASKARNKVEGWENRVQTAIDNTEDDQAVVDLELQMGVDAYQKATETISNMQKRFYDTARAVTQKFGG